MELTITIIVGIVFVLVGLACVVSVVIGLPGTWIMLGLAVAIEMLDHLYLTAGSDVTFGWRLLIICTVLAVIGEGLELIAGALGAKTAGSSRRGMWGTLLGGIIGAVLGIGIPLPVVGSLIGAVIGTFVGAIAGELAAEGATIRGSLRPASGATVGRILGTLAKVPIAIIVWAVLSVAAFR